MSNPASVQTSAPGSFGVCVAFGQNAFGMSPTWTRLDDPTVTAWGHKTAAPHNCNCVSNWTVDRGRTYEINKTQTGTATITLQDPHGLFDPTNPASPFFGDITPMMRGKISVQSPANNLYYDLFTGFVESLSWVMDQAERIMTVTLSLVDGFEPLTRSELQVEATGVTTLVALNSSAACQTRINGLLDAAGWPDDGLPGPSSYWRNINTGNVYLQQVVYNPETQILSCIQDTADAEFPGVANVFINKRGALTFYGRYPRFQPTNFPDDVNFWQVADKAGADTFGAARISDIAWAMDSTNLINACLSYPFGIAANNISGQLITNTASINAYGGVRQLSLTDLLCFGQPETPSQPAQPFTQSGANATAAYNALYYVQNYAQPQLRIQKLQFSSRGAGDSQTWQFMLGVEIGDLLSVFTNDPGGGGFSKGSYGSYPNQFFVEGLHYSANPNTQQIPDITLTIDSSPRSWFTEMPWTNALIQMTPSSGVVGATIQVNGTGFTSSGTISVATFNGSALSMGVPFSAFADGSFLSSFAVPSIANGTYEVFVTDTLGRSSTRKFTVHS